MTLRCPTIHTASIAILNQRVSVHHIWIFRSCFKLLLLLECVMVVFLVLCSDLVRLLFEIVVCPLTAHLGQIIDFIAVIHFIEIVDLDLIMLSIKRRILLLIVTIVHIIREPFNFKFLMFIFFIAHILLWEKAHLRRLFGDLELSHPSS